MTPKNGTSPPAGDLKESKKTKGGKRPGAGMPKGYKTHKTIEKEAARAALRQIVLEQMARLVEAQLDNALGIKHFIVRGKTGKFERLTDPAQIEAALNAPNAEEGSTYWIYTKDPSIQAFADLMNRAIDKPIEPMEVTVPEPIVLKWQE